MDVEVHAVLQGHYTDRILTASKTNDSSSKGFEQYVHGKKYLLAFYWDEDESGPVLIQSSRGPDFLEVFEP